MLFFHHSDFSESKSKLLSRVPSGGLLNPFPFHAMPAAIPALKMLSMIPPFSSTPAMIFFIRFPEREGTVNRKSD